MTEEELQSQIDELKSRLERLEIDTPVGDHQHTGFDVTQVEYDDLARKKLYIRHSIMGIQAATATNYGVFWIAPVACVITAFQEVHQTAGSDGGAVTINLEKLTGTTAADSGNLVLATALSLKATANTVQNGILTQTLLYRTLAAGDRLAIKDAGTLTNVAGVTISVKLTVL